MKRIIYHIVLCCSALMAFSACDKEGEFGPTPSGDGNDEIVLDISSASLPLTRAEATGAEVAIDHIDVLIFSGADQSLKHHERVSGIPDKEGKFTLAAKRSDFDPNAGYWVYLVANSTHTEADFKAIADINALKAMTQNDHYLHLTGITNITTVQVPQSFLMDGVAYLAKEVSEPVSAAPVELNDGVVSNNTELKVVLRRAAAKIVIHIKKGNDVSFLDSGSVYYLRNMPYSTSVVAGVDAEAELRTTTSANTSYLTWTSDKVSVTAYAYAHKWADDSALEKDVRMVVNVPLKYENAEYPRSYYQIPVSRDKVLARNTFYEVTVTVNAPGAVDPSKPLTLEPINYTVEPWEETTINVGGENNRPTFLYVNEEEFEMHNIDTDNTTLRFASSSAVTAKITRVYYIDKFGEEQDLEKRYPDNPENNEWGVKPGGWWQTWSNLCEICITPDEGISGKIDVFSSIPENNAVRYIEFTVTNGTEQKRSVKVAQYPLEYITNVVGWYSTRSDFGGTTYESPGTNRHVSASSYNSRTNTWDYDKSSSGFFSAKYVDRNSNGTSDIRYYRWVTYNYGTGGYVDSDTVQDADSSGNSNSRMYHVRITASSGTYTLGKPRITSEGITDPGADNAELVSPSFMIASQLGAVFSGNLDYNYEDGIEMAASHCKEYVEVAKDGTVYDDWRLPTKAEIEIIARFQRVEGSAVDVVLAGRRYYSASEIVDLGQGNNGTFLRCIRDAYIDGGE